MIATGANLAKAQWLAVELETIAKQYYLLLVHRRAGGAAATTRSTRVKERFKSYGPRPKAKPPTRTTAPKRKKKKG